MHKFRIGDRVIAVKSFDGNNHIIGVQGIVMSEITESNEWIGVVFDKPVRGHTGDYNWYRRCAHNRGWNMDAACLKYLGWRVNPLTADLGTAAD